VIVEAIKDGDRYILPINGEKEKIKVEIIEDDYENELMEAVFENYKIKRGRDVNLQIDKEILDKFIKLNNLKD